MTRKSACIRCTSCGEEAFLRREPVYDGFQKTGETLSCSACGYVYPDEEAVPYLASDRPQVFSEADRSKKVEVFTSEEQGRNCRHCRHYVVNPFTQRCGLHGMEVQATDLCGDFEARGDDEGEEEKDALSDLFK